jgi:hypothetical protein
MNNEKLIFLHIPKTAGTSLRTLVEQAYSPEELLFLYAAFEPHVLEAIQQALPKAKILYGHLCYGVHETLGITAKYVTFLRNPLDRVVSFYSHNAREPGMMWYAAIQAGRSLREMVESEVSVETNNHITRILASYAPAECLDDDAVLAQAIENLHRYFYFVGLSENLDAGVNTLKTALNWQVDAVPRLNSNPQPVEIDAATRAALEKYNRLDLLLYNHVQQHFRSDCVRDCELAGAIV